MVDCYHDTKHIPTNLLDTIQGFVKKTTYKQMTFENTNQTEITNLQMTRHVLVSKKLNFSQMNYDSISDLSFFKNWFIHRQCNRFEFFLQR